MEYFSKCAGDGTIVRVRRHYLAHVPPPFLADRRFCNLVPSLFVLYLCVAKKVTRIGLKKDRVVVNAVGFERFLKLRPDRRVPSLVFLMLLRVQMHDKSFSYHKLLSDQNLSPVVGHESTLYWGMRTSQASL